MKVLTLSGIDEFRFIKAPDFCKANSKDKLLTKGRNICNSSHEVNFLDLWYSYKSVSNNNLIEKLSTKISRKLIENTNSS